MRKIMCDRCGADISEDTDNVGYVSLHWKDVDSGDIVDNNPFEKWELCEDCYTEIFCYVGLYRTISRKSGCAVEGS